ncbi:MAG TPA: aspartyl-phosphate phosphatase Spo0E family protein [Clostridiaceae bacterium]
MSELEELLKDVEILRDKLERVIQEKYGNLVDPEVVSASKILNAALNEYNKVMDDKIGK